MSISTKPLQAADYKVAYNRMLGGTVSSKALSLRAPVEADIDNIWEMIFKDSRIMQTYPGAVEKTRDKTEKRIQEVCQKISETCWHSMVAVSRVGLVVGFIEMEQEFYNIRFKIAVVHPEQNNKIGSKILYMLSLYAEEMNKKLTTPCHFLVSTLTPNPHPAAKILFATPPFTAEEQIDLKQTVVKVAIGALPAT